MAAIKNYRKWNMSRRYGITPDQFDEMFRLQDNLCAICRLTINDRPCIDHCHVTQKVRGILCLKCNTMIGMANDNVGRLIAGCEYLQRHNGFHPPITENDDD